MVDYRPVPWMTYFAPLVFVIFAVFAVFLVVRTTRGGEGPGLWFTVLWLAAGLWNAYWWLLRVATRVRVDGGTVEWRTPVRRGSAPVASVRSIGRTRFGRDLAKLTLDDGRSVHMLVRAGFAGLVAAVREGAPHADVQGV